MNSRVPLSNIRVVLSHPSHPGNIGAAARAIKTMGLKRLYLVNPKDFFAGEARALASNALDVLGRAVICSTLEEALAGTAMQVAFTARPRVIAHPALEARAAAAEAVQCALTQEVALVFGSEVAGLANDEVMRCSRLAYIPSDPEHSSLNLGAAVQVAAYEVRVAAGARGNDDARSAPELARHEDVEHFFVHLERSLYASGFLHPAYPRRLMDRLRRMFGRIHLEKEEVNILRGMLAQWDSKTSPGRPADRES